MWSRGTRLPRKQAPCPSAVRTPQCGISRPAAAICDVLSLNMIQSVSHSIACTDAMYCTNGKLPVRHTVHYAMLFDQTCGLL